MKEKELSVLIRQIEHALEDIKKVVDEDWFAVETTGEIVDTKSVTDNLRLIKKSIYEYEDGDYPTADNRNKTVNSYYGFKDFVEFLTNELRDEITYTLIQYSKNTNHFGIRIKNNKTGVTFYVSRMYTGGDIRINYVDDIVLENNHLINVEFQFPIDEIDYISMLLRSELPKTVDDILPELKPFLVK